MKHEHLIVAIPARDEVDSIEECIRSVDQSAADAVAGIVDLDPDSTAPAVFEAFTGTYLLDGDRHGHVHGANIGMCASAYEAVGGWCSQTVVGEDHVMWHALRGVGHRMFQTTKLRVLTSARTRSRVLGGFATHLDKLDPQPKALLAAHV